MDGHNAFVHPLKFDELLIKVIFLQFSFMVHLHWDIVLSADHHYFGLLCMLQRALSCTKSLKNFLILSCVLASNGKCRTVGTYSPRRNHGRAMASRQTEKTVDTRHWRVDRLRIHSAKGDVTRSSTMEKKDIRVVVCCRQPSSRKVN